MGTPSVETRLSDAQLTLALITLLARGLETAEDTSMSADIARAAYTCLSDMASRAFFNLVAISRSLDGSTLNLDAPGKAGA